MAGTEMNKRRQYGSEALLIFFSIFALAVSLLVVSIRLMKQQAEGVPSTALLILAVFGIAGGVLGMLAAARSRANSSPVEEAPLPEAQPQAEANEPQESAAKVRLGKYVQVLEEQNQDLREENKKLSEEAGKLRSDTAEWQRRSLEMLRMLDGMGEDGSSIKKHFAQLVSPLGVGVIEPEPGAAFDEKLHQEAVTAPATDQEPGTVVECLEWGYTVNGQVETPAKVIVARTE